MEEEMLFLKDYTFHHDHRIFSLFISTILIKLSSASSSFSYDVFTFAKSL